MEGQRTGRVGRHETVRLTVGQAIVRFLIAQKVTRDGVAPEPFFGGIGGIFGHGNLAGLGQAIYEYRDEINFFQSRNEQGLVHIASGYAKMRNRLGALAVTTSVGPGATNMVTGAALATVNRLPVLLFPSDVFATRLVGPVLQQVEYATGQDASANDAFRSVSRYFDRINRPEQLIVALMEAMRVLTSPAETGAVTIALPEDVQTEAYDFPARLFEERVWTVPRPRASADGIQAALEAVSRAERPFIVAGGGVVYSEASDQLAALAERLGSPVGYTQAGKASLRFDHPLNVGALGSSGTHWANDLANDADVIIGVGTRYTDFTTGSKTMFPGDDVTFVNINVAELDSMKHAGIAVTGDARETLAELLSGLGAGAGRAERRTRAEEAAAGWHAEAEVIVAPGDDDELSQPEVIRLVDEAAADGDVVVGAAGSLPGDLHRLWRARDPRSYHMEYGYSTMGYEIAGGLGAKMADPERQVFVLVGDGSYLMMAQDIMTSVQEGKPLTIVLVDNQGYGSIEALSKASGAAGFGNRFLMRSESGQLDGEPVAIDLSMNARSLGAEVIEVSTRDGLTAALAEARVAARTTVIHVRVSRQARFGGSGAWWDVPVAEVSDLEETRRIRAEYEVAVAKQAYYL